MMIDMTWVPENYNLVLKYPLFNTKTLLKYVNLSILKPKLVISEQDWLLAH